MPRAVEGGFTVANRVIVLANRPIPSWRCAEARASVRGRMSRPPVRRGAEAPRRVKEVQRRRGAETYVLHACLPYVFTGQFGNALAAATTDVTAQHTLETMQMSFKPLLDFLTRNMRSLGVQGVLRPEVAYDTDFSVVCAGKWHQEDLACLR